MRVFHKRLSMHTTLQLFIAFIVNFVLRIVTQSRGKEVGKVIRCSFVKRFFHQGQSFRLTFQDDIARGRRVHRRISFPVSQFPFLLCDFTLLLCRWCRWKIGIVLLEKFTIKNRLWITLTKGHFLLRSWELRSIQISSGCRPFASNLSGQRISAGTVRRTLDTLLKGNLRLFRVHLFITGLFT